MGRIALVTPEPRAERAESDQVRALAAHPDVEPVWAPPGPLRGLTELPAARSADAVVVFVKARELLELPRFDWAGFEGRRVWLDHDAFRDFSAFEGAPGRWRAAFRRLGFDQLVCSGVRSAEHFASWGIDVAVVHKGVDGERFRDLGGQRRGWCSYGSPYRSRRALDRRLAAADVPVEVVRTPYPDLGAALNRHLGSVQTTRAATVRLGPVGRLVERWRPGTLLDYEPAPEPMLKHFEAAAAGCAVLTDLTPDLHLLGFEEGRSVVTFTSPTEAVERARHLLAHPEELRAIGARAAALCAERHTWAHRAGELVAAVLGAPA